MKVDRIKISAIKQDHNSRSEDKTQDVSDLMESMQQHGLIEPVGVNHEDNGTYTMMYGNRRLSAAMKLGWQTIPAVIHVEQTKVSQRITNLVENVVRKNLSPSEIGRILHDLEKEGLTVPEMSKRVGISVQNINSLMWIYKEVPEAQRKKVFFNTRGTRKSGRITVSAVTKVLKTRQSLGLKQADMFKLLEYARVNALSNEDIKIVSFLIRDGMTFRQALIRSKDYRCYRVDIIGVKNEIMQLAKKQNVSEITYIQKVIYGDEEPITKPTFINLDTKMRIKIRRESRKG